MFRRSRRRQKTEGVEITGLFTKQWYNIVHVEISVITYCWSEDGDRLCVCVNGPLQNDVNQMAQAWGTEIGKIQL